MKFKFLPPPTSKKLESVTSSDSSTTAILKSYAKAAMSVFSSSIKPNNTKQKQGLIPPSISETIKKDHETASISSETTRSISSSSDESTLSNAEAREAKRMLSGLDEAVDRAKRITPTTPFRREKEKRRSIF